MINRCERAVLAEGKHRKRTGAAKFGGGGDNDKARALQLDQMDVCRAHEAEARSGAETGLELRGCARKGKKADTGLAGASGHQVVSAKEGANGQGREAGKVALGCVLKGERRAGQAAATPLGECHGCGAQLGADKAFAGLGKPVYRPKGQALQSAGEGQRAIGLKAEQLCAGGLLLPGEQELCSPCADAGDRAACACGHLCRHQVEVRQVRGCVVQSKAGQPAFLTGGGQKVAGAANGCDSQRGNAPIKGFFTGSNIPCKAQNWHQGCSKKLEAGVGCQRGVSSGRILAGRRLIKRV